MSIQKIDMGETPAIVPVAVERTDPFKGEFSPSSIETAKCMRKYYFEKILKIKPKETPVALIFGICIHEAVEEFYTLKARDKGLSMPEVQTLVVQKFVDSWQSWGIIGDLKRNIDTGIICCMKYVEKYWSELDMFEIEDIETTQWIPMPNATMLLVKMDRVLNKDGRIILIDTKTTSMAITDWYFKQFENHLPTTLYYYTIQRLLGRCDHIVIDAIKVPPPTATSKSEAFGRATFLRTFLQIDDGVNTYIQRSDYIVEGLKKPRDEWPEHFFCNQGECDKYGGCSFLSICKHGFDHPSISSDFDIGETNA